LEAFESLEDVATLFFDDASDEEDELKDILSTHELTNKIISLIESINKKIMNKLIS
jgi:hypothetical protein